MIHSAITVSSSCWRGKPACRSERLVLAQTLNDAPQLGERLSPGPLRGLQRGTLVRLVAVQQPPYGADLQHDHAETVADDVVQLAGDACALELDRQFGAAVLLGAQLSRQPLQSGSVLALAPRRPTCEVRAADHQPSEDRVGRIAGRDHRDRGHERGKPGAQRRAGAKRERLQ